MLLIIDLFFHWASVSPGLSSDFCCSKVYIDNYKYKVHDIINSIRNEKNVYIRNYESCFLSFKDIKVLLFIMHFVLRTCQLCFMAVSSTFETWPFAFLVHFVKNKIILLKLKVLFEFNDHSVSCLWLFLDNQQDARKKEIKYDRVNSINRQ